MIVQKDVLPAQRALHQCGKVLSLCSFICKCFGPSSVKRAAICQQEMYALNSGRCNVENTWHRLILKMACLGCARTKFSPGLSLAATQMLFTKMMRKQGRLHSILYKTVETKVMFPLVYIVTLLLIIIITLLHHITVQNTAGDSYNKTNK